MDSTRDSYDRVASAYADRFLDELADKPLDRALLDLLATSVDGTIADLGCGPGHVARYLHERGVPTLGIDISPAMVEIASQTHPDVGFHVGDMRALRVPDRAWGGLVSLYAIIHVPAAELPAVCTEFHRVLRPGGLALVSFHLGSETRHLDEWFDRLVSLDFHLHSRATVEQALTSAGFTLSAYLERPPYPKEAETTRAYLLATASAAEDPSD
jgi:ubiquinone/menaquinone biosynthesis C-methylase UbiE